jgi:hypothetical protein
MDPVTIAAAVQATRTLLKSARGISDIAHSLDSMFKHQEDHAKKKKGKKPKTRQQQILRMRSGDKDYNDDTSISAVANDVLEKKKIDRGIEILSREIDNKWGKGTWQSILDEREKRIKENKENSKKRKEAAKRKAEEDKEYYKKIASWVGQILIVCGAIGGLIWFLVWAANRGVAS